MGQIAVDRSLCDNHGQCSIAAPDVFKMDEDGVLQYSETFDDALAGEVEEAIDVCPLQAIFWKE